MGIFDSVKINYILPDSGDLVGKEVFQTKSFDDSFMDNYTITEDGKLILHKETWEVVPEEERPYYGKPEWNQNPINQIMGSMKGIPQGDEVVDFHGIVNVYTNIGDVWYEYNFEFTRGEVSDVKRIYQEQD